MLVFGGAGQKSAWSDRASRLAAVPLASRPPGILRSDRRVLLVEEARCAVRAERIGHGPAVVEPALRLTHGPWGHRRVQVGDGSQSGQHVVRSYSGRQLPDEVAILECVEAGEGTGSLADRIDTSVWRVELPGVTLQELRPAVDAFLASDVVTVAKRTKNGLKDIDAREAVTSASAAEGVGCAILHMVVRQLTPAVRPDDVLAALAAVADLHPPLPARAVREAQGRLDDSGTVADPLGPDRAARTLHREEHAAI